MERVELEELAQSLHKRAEHLERKQRRFLAGMLVLVAVFLLVGWRKVQAPQENFKTHGLSIVDSIGVVSAKPSRGRKDLRAAQPGHGNYL